MLMDPVPLSNAYNRKEPNMLDNGLWFFLGANMAFLIVNLSEGKRIWINLVGALSAFVGILI